MSNISININVGFGETLEPVMENNNGVERMGDGSFRLILDHQAEFNIDRLENALLQMSYPALREALSNHLEQASKRKAQEQLNMVGVGSIEEHPSFYQVDGEVGRFTFKTYDVKNGENKPMFLGTEMFPGCQGRQWYQTSGFKEIALLCGAAQRSYRQITNVFNRSRHQEVGGTPLNTLRDGAQAEGLNVLDFLTKKTQNIFEEHGFDSNGVPNAGCPTVEQIKEKKLSFLGEQELQSTLVEVCVDMDKKGLSTTDIENVRKIVDTKETYEQAEQCVYIHIDDVGVKEQKEHRIKKDDNEKIITNQDDKEDKGNEKNKMDTEKKRATVQNTVARIENAGKGFTLTARSVHEILLFVLGFLLNNALLGMKILVCVDGQRHLQNSILAFFSWCPNVTLLLDWFHVVKKFKEGLSLACRGRELRNRHLKKLLTLLWFGLVDQAKEYLADIPAVDIKDGKVITKLIAYLERNRKWIPCYAMRSKLGLPNSSNPVERCNNLVTAKRQKHHGMSWSKNGSYALTSLAAITTNNATQQWVRNRTIPFTWAAKAA